MSEFEDEDGLEGELPYGSGSLLQGFGIIEPLLPWSKEFKPGAKVVNITLEPSMYGVIVGKIKPGSRRWKILLKRRRDVYRRDPLEGVRPEWIVLDPTEYEGAEAPYYEFRPTESRQVNQVFSWRHLEPVSHIGLQKAICEVEGSFRFEIEDEAPIKRLPNWMDVRRLF